MLSTTFSEYFHVVFTVPEEIADIALQNKRTVYGILFRATAETLSTIAADPQHLGGGDRLLRCTPHLGAESAPSSPSALRRSRRRTLTRRQDLDLLPASFLPIRERS